MSNINFEFRKGIFFIRFIDEIKEESKKLEEKLASSNKEMTAKNNAYKKASNQADKAQKTYDSYSTKKNQLTSQISKLKNNR